MVILLVMAQNALDSTRMVHGWIFEHQDYHYFLEPVDNYFEKGRYELIENQPFTGRMPGYWYPYMLLRFLFSQAVALNLLMALQVLLSGLSVYVLARFAEEVFRSKRLFQWVFWGYLLSTYTAVFDFQTITESFSVSAIIFFTWFLLKYLQEQRVKWLVLSGVFLTWAIFLRPFLGLNLVIIPVVLLIYYRKNLGRTLIHLMLWSIPFLLAEVPWVIRNHQVNGKFVPLTTGVDDYGRTYSQGWQSVRALFYHWGGQAAYFEPGMAYWFRRAPMEENFSLPDHAFEGVNYTREDIVELRNKYRENLLLESDEEFYYRDSLVATEADLYLSSYRENHFFRHNILSGVLGMKRLFVHSGSPFLPVPQGSDKNMFELGIKYFYLLFYLLVLVGSVPGLFLAIRNEGSRKMGVLLGLMIVQLILVLSYYSQYQGARYTISLYPWLLVLAAYFYYRLWINMGAKTPSVRT